MIPVFSSLSSRFPRRSARDVRDDVEQFVFELDDGEFVTIDEIRRNNPDFVVERVDVSRRKRWLSVFIVIAIVAFLSVVWIQIAQAQDVCDHHVTSGLLRNLINRGMAKIFYYGELPDGRLYGIMVLWNPSCQRALFSVYRTGPNGNVFKHVTHYYVSGAKGQNLRAAMNAAKMRVNAEVVGNVRSASPSIIFRAIPPVQRQLGEPGYRPPAGGTGKVKINENGGGGRGGGGALGGLHRNEQD